MFCYFDMDRFDACTIKCDPARIAELKERYRAVGDPYNGNPKYWISVRFNDDLPESLLKTLVRDSYGLVAAGLPAKERERIGISPMQK